MRACPCAYHSVIDLGLLVHHFMCLWLLWKCRPSGVAVVAEQVIFCLRKGGNMAEHMKIVYWIAV